MDVDMAESNDHDDFQQNSEAFLAWLQEKGATISSKIKLADLRQQCRGRGVLALHDISEDEELFAVPRAAILTIDTSTLPADIKQQSDDQWLPLITAMIYEHQQGASSAWKPYFDILPNTFNTLMFWKDEDLEHLEGSAVVNKIGKKSADDAFRTSILPILKQYPEAFKLDGKSDDELLQLCHRMGSTIMAYAFDLEKPDSEQAPADDEDWEEDEDEGKLLPKGMVPMADMLNADADRNNAKLFYEEDKVVMKSIKSIPAGEEIFNDYGPLPQADVLRRYGYTSPNYEKYDVVELGLILIQKLAKEQTKLPDKEIEERTTYLDEQGVLDDGFDVAHAANPESEQFPEELRLVLNTLTASKEDCDKWRRKDKLPKPELTPESLQLLYTTLVHRRADYTFDTAGEEDKAAREDLIHPEMAQSRRGMARSIVKAEKSILEEAADAVERVQKVSTGGQAKEKRALSTFEEESKSVREARRQTNPERQGKKTKHS